MAIRLVHGQIEGHPSTGFPFRKVHLLFSKTIGSTGSSFRGIFFSVSEPRTSLTHSPTPTLHTSKRRNVWWEAAIRALPAICEGAWTIWQYICWHCEVIALSRQRRCPWSPAAPVKEILRLIPCLAMREPAVSRNMGALRFFEAS